MDQINFTKYLNNKDQTVQINKKIEEMMVDMSEKQIIKYIQSSGE